MQQHYDSQMAVLAKAVLDQQEFIGGQRQQEQSAQYKSELDSFNESIAVSYTHLTLPTKA